MGRTQISWFTEFRNRGYNCVFPSGRKHTSGSVVVVVDREIVKVSEVLKSVTGLFAHGQYAQICPPKVRLGQFRFG